MRNSFSGNTLPVELHVY